MVLFGGFLGCVGWSICAGYSAQEAACKTSSELRVHKAAQEQTDKAIQASLKRIENGMARQQDKIEDLWRKNGHGG